MGEYEEEDDYERIRQENLRQRDQLVSKLGLFRLMSFYNNVSKLPSKIYHFLL